MDDRAMLGRTGEKRAEKFLKRNGYRIVTRNYRCPAGEIDLVALDGRTVVFAEVKTRADRQHADPQDAVNSAKQYRLIKTAMHFIAKTGSQGRSYRFDILAITSSDAKKMDIEHFKDAFAPAY